MFKSNDNKLEMASEKKMKYKLAPMVLAGSVGLIDGAYWFFSLYNLAFGLLFAATVITGPAAILIPLAGCAISGMLHTIRGIRAEAQRQKSIHDAEVKLDKAKEKVTNIEYTIGKINKQTVEEYQLKYDAHIEASAKKTTLQAPAEQEKQGFFKKGQHAVKSLYKKASPSIMGFLTGSRLTGRTIKNSTKLLRNMMILAGIPLSTLFAANPVIMGLFLGFVTTSVMGMLAIHFLEKRTSNAVKALKKEKKEINRKGKFYAEQPDIYAYRMSKKLGEKVTVGVGEPLTPGNSVEEAINDKNAPAKAEIQEAQQQEAETHVDETPDAPSANTSNASRGNIVVPTIILLGHENKTSKPRIQEDKQTEDTVRKQVFSCYSTEEALQEKAKIEDPQKKDKEVLQEKETVKDQEKIRKPNSNEDQRKNRISIKHLYPSFWSTSPMNCREEMDQLNAAQHPRVENRSLIIGF